MAWYQVKGNHADTVFSTRVRLARNLSGYPFADRLTGEQANEIIDRIEGALGGNAYTKWGAAELTPLAAQSLVEKHLISREFAAKKGPHALFCNDSKSISLMVCEEDHIRLQCILPGLALQDAYRLACECDDLLDGALPLAYDDKLGYLTHCPSNLGTGLRASVMLFLPALSEAHAIPSLARQLGKIGLTMRGIYGEGSESRGCLYQVSNQVTLGVSEEEILSRLEKAVADIIASEERLRALSGEAAERRADRIHRAEGILRHATLLSSAELFALFADVKLGIATGDVTSISHEELNTLFICAMPATLSLMQADAPKTALERDRARANFIRNVWEVKRA